VRHLLELINNQTKYSEKMNDIEIVRQLRVDDDTFEMLLRVSDEFLERYRSETGDYNDPPNQKEFDEWINSLIDFALEGEQWRYED